MAKARLAQVNLPDFGMPDAEPEIPAAIFAARVARLRERSAARGFDRLVIYGDREHSANLAYLTGFDPRFEEALLVLGTVGPPAILVGNECFGTRSPPRSPPPGGGSRLAERSCVTPWASPCTRTSCPSRTSPATCRRSCSGPIGR